MEICTGYIFLTSILKRFTGTPCSLACVDVGRVRWSAPESSSTQPTIPRNLPGPTHSSCFPSHHTRASLHHMHLQSPDPLAQAHQPTTTAGRLFSWDVSPTAFALQLTRRQRPDDSAQRVPAQPSRKMCFFAAPQWPLYQSLTQVSL